jgi:hypothetical protein
LGNSEAIEKILKNPSILKNSSRISEKQTYLTLSGIIEGSDSKEDWKGDLKP